MADLQEQKQISADNLKQAKEALDSLEIPFCLFLGSALGAYRDGDFCPGDVDDIDLGVNIEYFSRKDEIVEKFHEKGFAGGIAFEHPEGIGPEANFSKYYDGFKCKIDIFFLTPVGDKIAWVFYTNPPQVRLVNNYFDKFDKVTFYGTEYNVPGPIEDYLVENYGLEWKTPIHRDNWIWHVHNKAEIQ